MLSWVKRATRKTERAIAARADRALGAMLVAVFAGLPLAACAKKAPMAPVGSSSAAEKPPSGAVAFLFESLDDRPVSSTALRGKPTVLAFVGSDDLASQAEAGFLAVMAKHDGDKVNYALVAVEGPERKELVEGFRAFFESKFGVSLRTGMADSALLVGTSPFGDVRRLTIVLLDPGGKIVWQKVGIAKAGEIRAAMARLP